MRRGPHSRKPDSFMQLLTRSQTPSQSIQEFLAPPAAATMPDIEQVEGHGNALRTQLNMVDADVERLFVLIPRVQRDVRFRERVALHVLQLPPYGVVPTQVEAHAKQKIAVIVARLVVDNPVSPSLETLDQDGGPTSQRLQGLRGQIPNRQVVDCPEGQVDTVVVATRVPLMPPKADVASSIASASNDPHRIDGANQTHDTTRTASAVRTITDSGVSEVGDQGVDGGSFWARSRAYRHRGGRRLWSED